MKARSRAYRLRSVIRTVLDALDGQMKKWRNEIAVKDTVSILFALSDAELNPANQSNHQERILIMRAIFDNKALNPNDEQKIQSASRRLARAQERLDEARAMLRRVTPDAEIGRNAA